MRARGIMIGSARCYHMPTLTAERKNIGQYISGYVDGEGCFSIPIRPRPSLRIGWEVRPSFSVAQNRERKEILELMRQYFGCGAIRAHQGDNTLKFETRSIRDIAAKIIPHFKEHPLLSGKQKDFEYFRRACQIIAAQKHFGKSGVAAIVQLARRMNRSGKRDSMSEVILRSLGR